MQCLHLSQNNVDGLNNEDGLNTLNKHLKQTADIQDTKSIRYNKGPYELNFTAPQALPILEKLAPNDLSFNNRTFRKDF